MKKLDIRSIQVIHYIKVSDIIELTDALKDFMKFPLSMSLFYILIIVVSQRILLNITFLVSKVMTYVVKMVECLGH